MGGGDFVLYIRTAKAGRPYLFQPMYCWFPASGRNRLEDLPADIRSRDTSAVPREVCIAPINS